MSSKDSNKPNTRSRNKNIKKSNNTNKEYKSKNVSPIRNICKIDNGNDDDDNDDEEIDLDITFDELFENELFENELFENEIIENELFDVSNSNNVNNVSEEDDDEDEDDGDEDDGDEDDDNDDDDNNKNTHIDNNNLKRKFEEMFDNNTIIIVNSGSKSGMDNILSKSLEDNELDEQDDDDDYEDINQKINKNKKYIDKNLNFANYSNKEINYFLNLSVKNKNLINKFEKKTIELNKDEIPLRFRIINSKIDDNLKAIALKKLNHLSSMNERSGEYFKILNYVENLCKIPCGIYKKLNIPKQPKDVSNFLLNSYNILNKNVYGHDKSKEQIIRIIGQWISNPELKGNVIGIHGSPGCGKTRLIKEGLCKALNLPFVFIPLGGINDSAYLTGHSFTYEGAIHGKIVDSVMKAECMNPIIYFDELDKVSDSSRGEEIINTLIHLTDSTQNDSFYDKYFYDIPLNLSKALIIFTYNDDMLINRILRDRMIRINTESYNNKDKISISKEFLIPELLKDFNFTKDELIFSDEIINYIISKSEKEDGVRNLRRSIECIISNLNLFRLINKNSNINSLSISNLNIEYSTPLLINNKIVDYLIKNKNNMNDSIAHLYT